MIIITAENAERAARLVKAALQEFPDEECRVSLEKPPARNFAMGAMGYQPPRGKPKGQ